MNQTVDPLCPRLAAEQSDVERGLRIFGARVAGDGVAKGREGRFLPVPGKNAPDLVRESAAADAAPGVAKPEREEPAVSARDVCRNFLSPDGRELLVLRGVNLEVGRGETMAIMGPSG
ncbi:MAG: hypothetical protein P8Y07_00630, partial [Gemmatimonadales bacterium]